MKWSNLCILRLEGLSLLIVLVLGQQYQNKGVWWWFALTNSNWLYYYWLPHSLADWQLNLVKLTVTVTNDSGVTDIQSLKILTESCSSTFFHSTLRYGYPASSLFSFCTDCHVLLWLCQWVLSLLAVQMLSLLTQIIKYMMCDNWYPC